LVLFAVSPLRAEEPTSFVLTDSGDNLNRPEFQLSHRDIKKFKSGIWSVAKVTLHGGKQEGSELIILDNGRVEFAVCPTRGMSVVYLRESHGTKLQLGWDSPVKEVVHPRFMDLESRGGLGWLEGFNEWMCRCGLEFAGHPGKDVFTTNTGDKGELTLTLHGKIGNIPASKVSFSIDEKPPHRLRIKGTVYERSFYVYKLNL